MASMSIRGRPLVPLQSRVTVCAPSDGHEDAYTIRRAAVVGE
jgi:hypothetical protein